LNAFVIGTKLQFITGDILRITEIFECGVLLWATLVGALSVLILNHMYDFDSTITNNFIIVKMLSILYYLTMIFFGNMLNISYYNGIGGTFLILCGMHLEFSILSKVNSGNKIIMLLIIFVNLYSIQMLIKLYPEYWILNIN
jgi:hypothetical protein